MERLNFNPRALEFIKNTIGEDGLNSLLKTELVKESTQTVVDHEEVRTALNIVPRTVLAFLNEHLKGMSQFEVKEFKLPVEQESYINVKKLDNDVYSGYIHSGGKILARFKHRTLPGIGLIIMTTFELYDVDNLLIAQDISQDRAKEIDKIIDEKLAMRRMVEMVVERKLEERDAIENLINRRLYQMIKEYERDREIKRAELPKNTIDVVVIEPKKMNKVEKPKRKLKLKEFLEKRQAKHLVSLEKSQTVYCPDCLSPIVNNLKYRGCVCFGENMGSELSIKKTENGVLVEFDDSWTPENIEMLLSVLRKRNQIWK